MKLSEFVIPDEEGILHIACFFEFRQGRAGFFKLCTAVDSYRAIDAGIRIDRDRKKWMWDGDELREGTATCIACHTRFID